MGGWKSKEELGFSSSNFRKDDFINIEPGKHVQCFIAGDPVYFRKHWIQAIQKVRFHKETDCTFCKDYPDSKPSFKFRVNLIIIENGAKLAKVWEGGWQVHEDILALHDAGVDLERTPVQISARKSGGKVKTTIIPLMDKRLPDAHVAELKKIELKDIWNDPMILEATGKTAAGGTASAKSKADDEWGDSFGLDASSPTESVDGDIAAFEDADVPF